MIEEQRKDFTYKCLERYHAEGLSEEEKRKIENDIIECNSGIVKFLVNKICVGRMKKNEEDLMQEGYLGLLSAIRNYDFSMKNEFVTYAFTCIKNRILMMSKRYSKRRQINSFVKNFNKKNGRDPTVYEICDGRGITESVLYNELYGPILLDDKIKDSVSENSYNDLLVAPSENVEENIVNKSLVDDLKDIIRHLPECQKNVVTEVLFNDVSQIELAKKMGISRSAISANFNRGRMVLLEYLEGDLPKEKFIKQHFGKEANESKINLNK